MYLLKARCELQTIEHVLNELLDINPNNVPANIYLAQITRFHNKEVAFAAADRAKNIDPYLVELSSTYFLSLIHI